MLATSLEIIKEAEQKKRVVGAFNVLSLEMIQGVIQAAEALKTPVILQASTGALNWAKFEYLVPVLLNAAKIAKVKVAVHLDHCQDLKLLAKAIDAGFTSVMYDGSHLDFKANIEQSLIARKYANKQVPLELEIGKIGGKEDDIVNEKSMVLTIEEVKTFYQQTKPDLLAVAFGTAHGVYKQKVNLDFKLLRKCKNALDVPLVMHGTSNLDPHLIQEAIQAGVSKINVGTDLLIANFKAIRDYLKTNPEAYDIRKINTVGIEAIKMTVIKYLKLFNSSLK